jgi:hypothetical protein
MEQILKEHNLWKDGLLAQCPGFKCQTGVADCCCRRILFNQPDFANQKSALEELIESRGHICDFYPKYHCELNFIEMYWGAVKFRYRKSPRTSKMEEMRTNVKRCLDDVPNLSILRYANRAARFISAYAQGLNGSHISLVDKKYKSFGKVTGVTQLQLQSLKREYKSHRMLPPDVVRDIKAEVDR